MKKRVCVIGVDEFNSKKLNAFEGAQEYDYHSILEVSELQHCETYDMAELMSKAMDQIDDMDETPDAIVGFWNFPVTCLTPMLAREYNLPHLPLDALIKCEHKYLGRLEQEKIIPDKVPAFDIVNPFHSSPYESVSIDFPFWLKPIQSFASQLSFKIENKKDFDEALTVIRDKIHRFADPFNYVLDKVELPESIKGIDGYYCIAEEALPGVQATVEGYVHNGNIDFIGAFDSKRHRHHETFFSYEYPANLDQKSIANIEKTSTKILKNFGYDNSSFNIEYFYDKDNDDFWILEINPRISQSHSDPFQKVDGAPNHKSMVEVALGESPEFPHRKGDFKVAAKFYYRVFDDGVITKVPGDDDLEAIRKEMPDMEIKIWVDEGVRLSELHDQDSYSYKLASVYLGAENKKKLYDKRDRCFDLLNFKIDSTE
ncbi:ATP-grasp domain-containing protein [Rhodohalobacter sp. 8-1]|uniref:ATP-grasp domain-containing protein n=1 Tax=Rhodohalobacter sp. 8-1 TaxID=3131972 RepID=UPI0030EF568A